MPEIKDSPPPVIKQEKNFKSEIKRMLDVTKRFFDHEITVIDAFHEIADRNPQLQETPEPIAPALNENKIEMEQNKTNKEIDAITKELKVDLPQEPLINKNEYYRQREKNLGTFINSDKTQHEKNSYRKNDKKDISEKFDLISYILKLKVSGVKKATDFYNVLDERGFYYSDITNKQIINNLKKIPPKKIGLGIDRLNRFNFHLTKEDLLKDNIRKSILEAGNISDDKFNNICSELDPYFFLRGRNDDIYYMLDNLPKIFKNGHLDPEVKDRLDFIKETCMLDGYRYGGENHSYYWDFENKNVFDINEKITFTFPEERNYKDIFNSNFKLIYKNLDKFSNPIEFFRHISQEQIDQLPNNENGVADFLKQVYEVFYKREYHHQTDETSEDSVNEIINYVVKNQDKIHSSFRDESQRSQFLLDLAKNTSQEENNENERNDFIRNLQKIKITGVEYASTHMLINEIISFPNKNDQNYWETISGIRNPSLLKSLIDNKDQFFDDNNFPKLYFFETIVKNRENSSLIIKYLYDDSLSKFPLKDKTMLSLYRDIYSRNFDQQENFDNFFADNISDFSKFLDNNKPNNLFFKSLATSMVTIPMELIPEENFVNFNDQDKAIWSLYRDIYQINYACNKQENFKNFFADNISDFSKFLDNNKPNNLFFKSLVTSKVTIPRKLISEENFVNFIDDQDKAIWSLYRDIYQSNYLRENFNDFFADNISDFSKFLDNNKPNGLFFKSLMISKIDIPEELIFNNIDNFIDDQDKTMWSLCRDLYYSNKWSKEKIINFFTDNISDFSKFLDNNKPNGLFFKTLMISKIDIPEELIFNNIDNFIDDQDKTMWSLYREFYPSNSDEQENFKNFFADNISDFSKFLDNNKPNSLFFKTLVTSKIDITGKFIFQDFINNRPQDETNFWNKFKEISPNLQKKIIEIYFNDSLSIEEKYNYIVVSEKIEQSPSKEILRIKDQLLEEIIKNNNPEEVFYKISNIFIKNNLPQFVKKYKVFEILYPKDKINSNLNERSSRVLFTEKRDALRHSIVFNDLIKIAIESGDVSLKNYLTFFKESDSLLKRGKNGGPLTEKENKQLTYFLKKLETVYDNSFPSLINQNKKSEPSVLTEKINNLYQNYRVKEGRKISDRVVEMYLYRLGIKTIDQALDIMKESKETAHNRGLKYFNDSDISIEPNDLIKGVGSDILGSVLDSGFTCREFLGSEAKSDATPFDADVSANIFNTKYSNEKIREFIGGSASGLGGYGDLLLVVKDRGQFQNTSNETSTAKYQPEKLEVFSTLGGTHFGVRTGFSSSEIDYLIVQDSIKDDSKKLEDMYYEIAKHGVYIPIANLDGQIIFTPDDYNKYHQAFDGVDQFDGKPISVEVSKERDWSHSLIQDIKKDKEKEEKESTIKSKDEQIRNRIKEILTGVGVEMKDDFDTSVLGAKLYNIGSSGRNTNVPNDFDFDYTLILDVPSYQKINDIKNSILTNIKHESEKPTDQNNQIRMSEVTGISSETIDLDIGINTFADTLIFASHEAIEQKLNSIRKNNGEEVYKEVVANIILTKQILKENHAYKKGNSQDGGFSGIGVENWILGNNGNIEKAFKTFWQASHKDGMIVPLDEFRKIYPILDSGANLRETSRTHDNFSFVLTEKGYQAMIKAIGKYIK